VLQVVPSSVFDPSRDNVPVLVTTTSLLGSAIYPGRFTLNDLYSAMPFKDEDFSVLAGCSADQIGAAMNATSFELGEGPPGLGLVGSPPGWPAYFLYPPVEQLKDGVSYDLVATNYDAATFGAAFEELGFPQRVEGYSAKSPWGALYDYVKTFWLH
jgi:hypothetical protein